MKLCEKKTLEDIIEEIENDPYLVKDDLLSPIGYFVSRKLFIQILESVYYLHQNNIIHRDLKPMNILLKTDINGKCHVKIADFGLATLHKFSKQPHSEDKGTPKYMAPEVTNSDKYSEKSDIYSLGIVFWNLLNLLAYK
jgi:serine/threonine protein kinase